MAARCILYYITDRAQFPGNASECRPALLSKIEEAARAGVDCIQLREKDLSTRELEVLARECVALLEELRTENRELRTCFLINSRTDVALAVGADGVHLRSDDVSPADVRRVVAERGKECFSIAKSCHTPAEVRRADAEGADFAVFAPVFEKRERPGAQPAGISALRDACEAKIPVLALGGVTLQNAASCLEAGAARIAGIRLFQENRIDEVVRALRAL